MLKQPKGHVSAKGPSAPGKGAAGSETPQDLVSVSDLLPSNLWLLPVSQTTLFPGMIVPLVLPEGKLIKTIDHVIEKTGHVGVVLSKNPSERAIAAGPSTSFTGLPAEGTVAAGLISDETPAEE